MRTHDTRIDDIDPQDAPDYCPTGCGCLTDGELCEACEEQTECPGPPPPRPPTGFAALRDFRVPPASPGWDGLPVEPNDDDLPF